MNNETPYQRYLKRLDRTPTSEADILITNLEDAYRRLVVSRNSNPKIPDELKVEDAPLHETAFFNALIKPGAANGDELAEAYRLHHPANQDGVFDLDEAESLPIALCYCIQAYRADSDGRRDLAWTYIIDSRTWFTPSLMMRPRKIEYVRKTKKKRSDCSAAGLISQEVRYGDYREFVINEYKSGRWIGEVKKKRKNMGARTAAAIIAPKLEQVVKNSKGGGLSTAGDNAFRWCYDRLREFDKDKK